MLWPAEHLDRVGVVLAVVCYHFELLGPQGAAEVPLPDGRVALGLAVPAHLRPGLAHRRGTVIITLWMSSYAKGLPHHRRVVTTGGLF